MKLKKKGYAVVVVADTAVTVIAKDSGFKLYF